MASSSGLSENAMSPPLLNIEQLSKNFVKGERYKSDMNAERFNSDCANFLKDLQLSSGYEIAAFERRTLKQSESSRWLAENKYRLTAANFGFVIDLQDTSYRSHLVKFVLGHTSPSKSGLMSEEDLDYGRDNALTAINDYRKTSKKTISVCGVFVHPEFGYLAASPNGLIDDKGIVAIRCPFFARNISPLEIPKNTEDFYCSLSSDGSSLMLSPQHSDYYQIQGQLEITDREWCDYVIWTPHGIHVERISRDRSFWNEMLPKLRLFYILSVLPEIVDCRLARDLPIREPDFVLDAIEKSRSKGMTEHA